MCCGNPELVTVAVNGYLVQGSNIEELADRLGTLIEKPKLREKLGREGAARVRGHCSIETMPTAHISLDRSLSPEVS